MDTRPNCGTRDRPRRRSIAGRTRSEVGRRAAACRLSTTVETRPQDQARAEILVLRLGRPGLSARRADGCLVVGAEASGPGRGMAGLWSVPVT